jgi:hypothetical protein
MMRGLLRIILLANAVAAYGLERETSTLLTKTRACPKNHKSNTHGYGGGYVSPLESYHGNSVSSLGRHGYGIPASMSRGSAAPPHVDEHDHDWFTKSSATGAPFVSASSTGHEVSQSEDAAVSLGSVV